MTDVALVVEAADYYVVEVVHFVVVETADVAA